MLSGKRAEEGKKEEHGFMKKEKKMRNECRALAVEGPHDFSFPRRAVKIARVQPPARVVFPANSQPYYRHNNKVNALQIKRTRKTFRVVLCPF